MPKNSFTQVTTTSDIKEVRVVVNGTVHFVRFQQGLSVEVTESDRILTVDINYNDGE